MTDINRRDINRLIAAGAIGAAGLVSTAEAAVPHGYRLHPQKGLVQMTQELGKLTVEHFEALVGETFVIGEHRTKLRSVRRGPPTLARFREQFALTFDTPAGANISSVVLPVSHPAIGNHNLLVTQVIDATDPTALEICFG